MTASKDKLGILFRAFATRNDSAFLKAAESIIADELAANHHALASELEKALSQRRAPGRDRPAKRLSHLPRDRRNGEALVALQESSISEERVILGKETQHKIRRIIDEHSNRSRLEKHGYSPKSKLLFWGPPGCGKTHTSFYLAHELGLPIGVLRLNAVISSFLGDTASHLQRVFDLAHTSPMVLLLDEIDAVGKDRDDRNDVGEQKRVVNSLLQAMDSFQPDRSIVVAASNHQYLLDPAIWRRFDDIVHFPPPEKAERERHLRFLLNGVTLKGSFANISKSLSSFSYADIERTVTEAIKTMLLEGRDTLQSSDITEQFRAFRKALSEARTGRRGTDRRGSKK